MIDIINRIGCMGLVPVVVLDDIEKAVPTAEALINGGLDVMEITMRTEQAISSIKRVKEIYPNMLVGAGTVLTLDQAKEAVDAGAEFIVAPGLNIELVQWCIESRIPAIPGCVTPTEIDQALRLGLKVLKFFPAKIFGGIDGCKALCEPYRMVRFIPTGGINLQNLTEYADKPYIHAIGGGWLCKTSDIDVMNYGAITWTVKESVDVLLGFELAHVGSNAEDAEMSLRIANMLQSKFGYAVKKGNSSNYAGSCIEANKKSGLGVTRQLAIETNNITRAAYYLEKKGICS